MILWSLFCCLACTSDAQKGRKNVDELNRESYALRYKHVAHSNQKAQEAYETAKRLGYPAGICEALCNKSFYALARMQYDEADRLLAEAQKFAPDNVSKLNIEVLQMRLCQRRSLNKEFYVHKSRAQRLIKSIENNRKTLTNNQRDMFVFSCSEYSIVLSAYLYYVNKKEKSSEVLLALGANEDLTLQSDTAQWLSYLYNIGAGGVLVDNEAKPVPAREFDYLMQCYLLASHCGYVYWEANALQGLSEHLNSASKMECIKQYDYPSIRYLQDDGVPDTLLSKELAQHSLDLFVRYGDVYQAAGAWRSLADTYYRSEDWMEMLNCLEKALEDSCVYQSPDLVASIDERLCIAYSALDNKYMADVTRNEFLDIQDSTRQDRQLEARTDELHAKINVLNHILIVIFCAIVLLCIVFATLIYYRKKKGFAKNFRNLSDLYEELTERRDMLTLKISDERRLGVEHHAKAAFVQSMQPLVDRMLHASQRVCNSTINADQTLSELHYMKDLCRSISEGNQLLTNWIQLRKGNIRLRVETFAISDVFAVVKMNAASFVSKGITLNVPTCDIYVKADRVLTLFLINTIVDNARKYTSTGGQISLECIESAEEGYADISVTDTGCGMPKDVVEHLFEYHVIEDSHESLEEQKSHGFGLMNCRGIIDRYRKTSELFHKTEIFAESRVGEGTKITFRLPRVVKTLLIMLTICLASLPPTNAADNIREVSNIASQTNKQTNNAAFYKRKASEYCDSLYNSNVYGCYDKAMFYADSCRTALNSYYLALNPGGKDTLSWDSDGAELTWWRDSLDVDYGVLLAMRNEVAVASLALRKWKLYEDNNSVYIRLYSMCSADATLDEYISEMQKYETLADYAFIILGLVIVSIFVIFYRLYLKDFFFEKRNLKQCISNLREDIQVGESEYERLYTANSVMENCLSTIKHETMYYPSRISRLLDKPADLDILHSTVEFYRTLYIILASHCQNLMTETSVKPTIVSLKAFFEKHSNVIDSSSVSFFESDIRLIGDESLIEFLFVILKRINRESAVIEALRVDKSQNYVTFSIKCDNVMMDATQANLAFQMQTNDVNLLLIKQILREIGNATSRYSTGVTIRRMSENADIPSSVVFDIVLPLAYK